jgi:hypothetical protein
MPVLHAEGWRENGGSSVKKLTECPGRCQQKSGMWSGYAEA